MFGMFEKKQPEELISFTPIKKTKPIVQSFEVRAINRRSVSHLAFDLNNKLTMLQQNGWTILNVVPIPVKEYEYPEYFDSTLFTIIARKEIEE